MSEWKQEYTKVSLTGILNAAGDKFTPKKGKKIELVEVAAVDLQKDVVIYRVLLSTTEVAA